LPSIIYKTNFYYLSKETEEAEEVEFWLGRRKIDTFSAMRAAVMWRAVKVMIILAGGRKTCFGLKQEQSMALIR
jgi:hypothetical protein